MPEGRAIGRAPARARVTRARQGHPVPPAAWKGARMTKHDISHGLPDRRPGFLPVMPLLVMPGLVPGISIEAIAVAEMDARNKSGHDGGGARA